MIRRALEKKDAQKIATSAHALKGSISIFGAAAAVAIARTLELAGRSGNLIGADSQFRALESEFARLKPELLAILSPPKEKLGTRRKTKPKSRRSR